MTSSTILLQLAIDSAVGSSGTPHRLEKFQVSDRRSARRTAGQRSAADPREGGERGEGGRGERVISPPLVRRGQPPCSSSAD